MKALKFTASSSFASSVEQLWLFHQRPDALELLSPPLVPTTIVEPGRGVAEGSEVVLEVGVWPAKARWRALHTRVRAAVEFVDVALESPFPYWIHIHRFDSEGGGRSRLTDTVWYLPPSWMPRTVARPVIGLMLGLLFRWRHRRTRQGLAVPARSVPDPVYAETNHPRGE